MRIAYVVHWDISREDGVTKKIRTQSRYWQREADVEVFAFSRQAKRSSVPSTMANQFYYRSFLQRMASVRRLVSAVNAWSPDAIYYRYNPPYPSLVTLLKHYPTIVEINTNDVEEYRLGSPHRHYYNLIARNWVFRHAAGLVSVSREIAVLPCNARFGLPTLVLGNSIDLDDFSPLPVPQNTRPRLVYMGSANQPWQGVDKLLWLAERATEFDFDIIGLKQKDFKHPLPHNVAAHGYLRRNQYERILASADVAVGTLALARKCLNETSPLKVREYLAYGLPVILGCQDTDFMEGAGFLLQLPNTEDNVHCNLERIRRFVKEMMGYRVPRELVAPRIDAAVKERQRMQFIRTLLKNR